MADGGDGYTCFVEPGNIVTHAGSSTPETDATLAGCREGAGLSFEEEGARRDHREVNIGVGRPNAKTITKPWRYCVRMRG